eukprot:2087107-Rhodomonas_salina.1
MEDRPGAATQTPAPPAAPTAGAPAGTSVPAGFAAVDQDLRVLIVGSLIMTLRTVSYSRQMRKCGADCAIPTLTGRQSVASRWLISVRRRNQRDLLLVREARIKAERAEAEREVAARAAVALRDLFSAMFVSFLTSLVVSSGCKKQTAEDIEEFINELMLAGSADSGTQVAMIAKQVLDKAEKERKE